MVEEGRTHAGHLISQGTADIILDACADLWTGNDLEQLSDDVSLKQVHKHNLCPSNSRIT